jgi:uncharacterized membrane protein
MKKNLHSIDRLIRIILALVFAFLIFNGTLSGAAGIIFGILAIVFLATGLISFCPIYAALGISTAKEKTKTA